MSDIFNATACLNSFWNDFIEQDKSPRIKKSYQTFEIRK